MKNYTKIFSTLFSILFIIIFSFFYFNEYKSFHQEKIEIEKNKLELKEKIKNFNLEDIKELKNTDFFYTPNEKLLNIIIDYINNSKTEIYLESYMLTEKRIQEALIKAKKRGIYIEIILEKTPYLAYNINNKAYDKLKNSGINIVWSNKDNYSLNHSKVLLIDKLSIISSGNFSYSTFTENRDFFIITKNETINKKLKENFKNDFTGKKINIYDDNLIFSPNTSRTKFEKLIDGANDNLKMYFQYLYDEKLLEKIIKIKKEKNIEITIVIPDTAKEDENTKKLERNGINIIVLKKAKMHAKAILVDQKYLFIGSINFSETSIDSNREIGILIKNKNIIKDFLNIFYTDLNISGKK